MRLYILLLIISLFDYSSPSAIASFKPGGQYASLTLSIASPHYSVARLKAILRVLSTHSISATFFLHIQILLGSNISRQTSLFQEVAALGHEIGLEETEPREPHSFRQVEPNPLLSNLTTTYPKLSYRPIYRNFHSSSHNVSMDHFSSRLLSQSNWQPVLWSADCIHLYPRFAAEIAQSRSGSTINTKVSSSGVVDQAVQDLLQQAQPGVIVAVHLSIPGGQLWLDILRKFLTEMTTQGYEFVTIEKMKQFPDDTPR